MPKFMNITKVITGVNTRWSYANVWDPKSINGGTPKYSVSLIIPKSDTATIEKIKAAIQAAYEEGQSKLKGNGKSVPALSAIKTPLRNGDLPVCLQFQRQPGHRMRPKQPSEDPRRRTPRRQIQG